MMIRLFNGGVMTGTNTLLSPWLDMNGIEKCSVEFQITGTPTGVLTWEATNQPNGSNPQQPDPAAAGVTMPSVSTPALPAVAGAPVSALGALSIVNLGSYRWIRMRYVNSSGVGVLNVYCHASRPA